MTFSTTWKPPLTHLMDDDSPDAKTLCGVAIGRDWEAAIECQTSENIEDRIACSCLRCARIAQKRIASRPTTGDGAL